MYVGVAENPLAFTDVSWSFMISLKIVLLLELADNLWLIDSGTYLIIDGE